MKERPISVLIFGILNIGFALLGLLGLLFSVLIVPHMNGGKNPMLEQMNSSPGYAAWMRISTPLGGVVSLILLAAGVGLLMLQNWARIVSIGYGVYTIIMCIVGSIVMVNLFSTLAAQSPAPQLFRVFMAIGMVFGLLIGLAYPILLIIFMTRPKVVAAFRPEQPVA